MSFKAVSPSQPAVHCWVSQETKDGLELVNVIIRHIRIL